MDASPRLPRSLLLFFSRAAALACCPWTLTPGLSSAHLTDNSAAARGAERGSERLQHVGAHRAEGQGAAGTTRLLTQAECRSLVASMGRYLSEVGERGAQNRWGAGAEEEGTAV